MKLNFKKDLACNITLICVLSLSFIYFMLLTLNLFNVFAFNFPQSFSYITAYLLMILCFGLYVLGFFIETRKSIKIPTWLKMTFYVAFFIFTNIYYRYFFITFQSAKNNAQWNNNSLSIFFYLMSFLVYFT